MLASIFIENLLNPVQDLNKGGHFSMYRAVRPPLKGGQIGPAVQNLQSTLV
jgi:hypothetical protein